MSLREEMWKYEQITGESAEHVPIIKLGAFLDGYEMAIKTLEQQPKTDVLDKIRAEIKTMSGDIETIVDVLQIIDKYNTESEVEDCGSN